MTLDRTTGVVTTRLGTGFTQVTIRAERTDSFVTVSLADESREIMIQVPYDKIKSVVRETYKNGGRQ